MTSTQAITEFPSAPAASDVPVPSDRAAASQPDQAATFSVTPAAETLTRLAPLRASVPAGRTCVILAPGGLPGIEAHVGAWLALAEHGYAPDQLCGTSAGAIVGALWAAGRMTAHDAVAFVRDLRTDDVIAKRWGWKARAFWITDFVDTIPLQQLLAELLPGSFEELKIPLTINATDMFSERPLRRHFNSGKELRRAVLASASISGVFPYVEVDGGDYSDGGTTDAIVIPRDLDSYQNIIVVNIVRRTPFAERDRNMISRLLWNVEALSDKEADAHRISMNRRFHDRLTWLDIDIQGTSCLKFSADHALIDQAHDTVARLLSYQPDTTPETKGP